MYLLFKIFLLISLNYSHESYFNLISKKKIYFKNSEQNSIDNTKTNMISNIDMLTTIMQMTITTIKNEKQTKKVENYFNQFNKVFPKNFINDLVVSYFLITVSEILNSNEELEIFLNYIKETKYFKDYDFEDKKNLVDIMNIIVSKKKEINVKIQNYINENKKTYEFIDFKKLDIKIDIFISIDLFLNFNNLLKFEFDSFKKYINNYSKKITLLEE